MKNSWIKKNVKLFFHLLNSLRVKFLAYLLPKDCYVQQLPYELLGKDYDRFKSSYKKNDKLFGWTLSDPNRSAMFYLLLKNIEHLQGDFAEVGTHQGSTARILFQEKRKGEELFIFDTFEGFDSRDVEFESTIGVNTKSGHFSNTSISSVNKEITGNNNGDASLITRKGYFPETFIGLESRKWKFVHLDADLYNPMKAGLELFYPRLIKGGYLLVHDYGGEYQGTRKAVLEFMETNDVTLVPMYDKVGSALIIKN